MPDRIIHLGGSLYKDTQTGMVGSKFQLEMYAATNQTGAKPPGYTESYPSRSAQGAAGFARQSVPSTRYRYSGEDPNLIALREALRAQEQGSRSTPGTQPTPGATPIPNRGGYPRTGSPIPNLDFSLPPINPNDWMGTQVPDYTTPSSYTGVPPLGQIEPESPFRPWNMGVRDTPKTSNGPSDSDFAVRSSLGRQPRTFEELDALWKQGSITPEQYDQLELQISNNPYSPTSEEEMSYQDGNMDPAQQAGRAWWDRPWNFAGSDLSTELYMLGMGIGSKPGTRGRAAAIIGGGGAALFDIARNVTSGIGYQRRNQYVNDYYRQQQDRTQYSPVSQTANDNYLGGIPTGKIGGMFVMGVNGPEISNTGQWNGIGEYRVPSKEGEITMQGVDQPIMAVPQNGEPVVMLPGQEYSFPGSAYVDEYPMYQTGGEAGQPTQEQVWEATMNWLNEHPIQVDKDKPLNIDNFEQVQTSGAYPKLSGKVAYVPKAGYFGEDKYKPVEMPVDYKGLPVYEINGKYVVFDQDFNKEFFNLYQEPKGKTRELYPVYGRGIPYRTQQFTSDPAESVTPEPPVPQRRDGGEQGEQRVGDYIEFEYDGEVKKGVIKKIENGKIFI